MLHVMKPDIVHETYFSPYRLGAQRPRRVLTIYDMIHEKFPSSFPDADKTARYKALATERADHVICISESTRRDAIEILGLHPDKTSVIYLGFDLMHADGERAGDLVSSSNNPFLLYVGNRGGYKNFLGLLEAYATSPQLKTGYRLICFGGGTLNMDEQKAIHALGMDSSQVMQLGGSDQMLAGLYGHASAFIYPRCTKDLVCRRWKRCHMVVLSSAAKPALFRRLWAMPVNILTLLISKACAPLSNESSRRIAIGNY